MEKRTVFLIAGVILAAVLIFSVYKLTGQATVGDVGACQDSDGGDDKYVQGIAKYANREKTYTDYCYSRSAAGGNEWLHEYYCLGKMTSKRYKCEKGCVNGACVK